MSDPLQQPPEKPTGTLFDSTSRRAGDIAARSVGKRHAQILDLLTRNGPLAIFETAAYLGVFDHQISGRFGELERDGKIEKTGEEKIKPDTGCSCALYHVRAPVPPPDLGPFLGYPDTLTLEGTLFIRQVHIEDTHPGQVYLSKGGQITAIHRVHLVPCPHCGAPVKRIGEAKEKKLQCSAQCRHIWTAMIVHSPGQPELLALVMKTMEGCV